MFTAYIAFLVLGCTAIALMPDTRTARAVKFAIYAVVLAGMLFFVALAYGQYAANAPM